MIARPVFPTIATIIAEDHAAEGGALWCCPHCGGLNASDDDLEPEASAGWCQHDTCLDVRDVIRALPFVTPTPEILHGVYRLPGCASQVFA